MLFTLNSGPNPKAWQEEEEKRREWEATLADGLDEA
jgi:hypothetical protein